MKLVAKIAALGVLCLASASAALPSVPTRFYRVDGRPVPVSCLEQLALQDNSTARSRIDLRTCGDPDRRPKTHSDGSIGYDTSDRGYFFYSYVGQIGDIDVLSLQSSGGGTGRFTQLVGVTHRGRFVTWARYYGGGDRCNGGVSGERIANGKLMFEQAITP
jgi:hypothetical protein